MQQGEIQWRSPVTRLILAIAQAVVLIRPWGNSRRWRDQIDESANAVMAWIANEPAAFEVIPLMDEFTSVHSDGDLEFRFDRLQSSLGLVPIEREQLSALLAMFVLRRHQSNDDLTESLSMIWNVMSEFDLNSLPKAVLGLMYMAELLAEGEESSMILGRARELFEQADPEIRVFEGEALLPTLNSPAWLPNLLCSQSPPRCG